MAKKGYESITVRTATKERLDKVGAEVANGQIIGSKVLTLSYEEIIDVLITEREQRRAKK